MPGWALNRLGRDVWMLLSWKLRNQQFPRTAVSLARQFRCRAVSALSQFPGLALEALHAAGTSFTHNPNIMTSSLGTPIVESAQRSAAFDNRLTVGDDERFLTDPLAEEYIVVPPGGGTVRAGMLPPQEMEVRAALIESMAVCKRALETERRIGFWKGLLGSREVTEAHALVQAKMTALAETMNRSREHRAAATRIYRSYHGDVRGILDWARRLA